MKLYLFLRSIIWTSVISIALALASIISAFAPASTPLTFALGLASITFAILAPRRNEY
jgi:uncharacterized membrane protein